MKETQKQTRLVLPAGFTTEFTAEDRLAMVVFGRGGSGKTRFCCTAKGTIGFIPLNRKARNTAVKCRDEFSKTIVMPEKDFIRVENPMKIAMMQKDAAISHYRRFVDSVKEVTYKLYETAGIDTIVVDDGTTFFESIKFAIWGRPQDIDNREKGPLNQEMKQFIDNLSGKNFLFPHQSKDLWSSTKPIGPTGEIWPEGYPHIDYATNVLVELGHNKDVDLSKKGASGRYYLKIAQCQDNPELQGKTKHLLDDAINFQQLACLIYPDSDPESWE